MSTKALGSPSGTRRKRAMHGIRGVSGWVSSLLDPKTWLVVGCTATAVLTTLILAMVEATGLFRMIAFIVILAAVVVVRRYFLAKHQYVPTNYDGVPPPRVNEMVVVSGEEALCWWRQHPLALVFEAPFGPVSIVTIVLGVPLWVFFFRWWLILIPLAATVWLGVIALCRLPNWRVKWYALTKHRLLETGNIFSKTGIGVGLKRVLDRQLVRPWYCRLLHFLGVTEGVCGVIKEETAGPNAETKRTLDYMTWIPRVMEKYMLIEHHQYADGTGPDGT